MRTNLHEHFKVNDKAAKEGIDFAFGEAVFTMSYFNKDNPRAKAAMATHYKPYLRQIETNTLSPEKSAEITRKLFLDMCLIGWKGVKDESGEEIAFSKENAIKLFEELPELFSVLWKYCNDFQNYKEELGNS